MQHNAIAYKYFLYIASWFICISKIGIENLHAFRWRRLHVSLSAQKEPEWGVYGMEIQEMLQVAWPVFFCELQVS